MIIRSLSRLECTALLLKNRVGYLACVHERQPYVVPVYFACQDNRIYAFSMPGKKIDWMRANPLVSIFVEERSNGLEWKSVVVDGSYEELVGHDQRQEAWALLSKHPNWWEPGGLKPVTPALSSHSNHIFFQIRIDQLTGREAGMGPT
ncbi:MAG: pyridoxamine 5'-phosphate oxidase family protein [Pseudorhodobacter sp.]|nr:pyridoxamine 5'-phosphate oxidase family protein [Pseudorhodobacter sp.]